MGPSSITANVTWHWTLRLHLQTWQESERDNKPQNGQPRIDYKYQALGPCLKAIFHNYFLSSNVWTFDGPNCLSILMLPLLTQSPPLSSDISSMALECWHLYVRRQSQAALCKRWQRLAEPPCGARWGFNLEIRDEIDQFVILLFPTVEVLFNFNST